MNLDDLALRLDDEERILVRYRCPMQSPDGRTVWSEREDELLDVTVEGERLWVRHNDTVIWIKPEEVLDVISLGRDGEGRAP